MNKYAFIAGLALVAAGFGAVSAQKMEELKPKMMPESGPKAELNSNSDDWMKLIKGKLNRDEEVSTNDFDSYFNDELFKPAEEPLKEMERMEKRIEADLEAQRNMFRRSYRQWHALRTEMPELDTKVTGGADKITVSVKKPFEKPESLKVSVKKNMITIDFSSKSVTESKKDGETVKSSFSMESRKMMPVPAGADPSRYTVEDTGGRMNIVFARLPAK